MARQTQPVPALEIRSSRPLNRFLLGLPELSGSPIYVRALAQLTASRGRLLSGRPTTGTAVHAASFIRDRRIVLDSALLRSPQTFRLILTHEIFHFVWALLGNSKRQEFARLLEREFAARAIGELGESAAVKKSARPMPGTRAWRDYVCESFCDTAAFICVPLERSLAYTLGNPGPSSVELGSTAPSPSAAAVNSSELAAARTAVARFQPIRRVISRRMPIRV